MQVMVPVLFVVVSPREEGIALAVGLVLLEEGAVQVIKLIMSLRCWWSVCLRAI